MTEKYKLKRLLIDIREFFPEQNSKSIEKVKIDLGNLFKNIPKELAGNTVGKILALYYLSAKIKDMIKLYESQFKENNSFLTETIIKRLNDVLILIDYHKQKLVSNPIAELMLLVEKLASKPTKTKIKSNPSDDLLNRVTEEALETEFYAISTQFKIALENYVTNLDNQSNKIKVETYAAQLIRCLKNNYIKKAVKEKYYAGLMANVFRDTNNLEVLSAVVNSHSKQNIQEKIEALIKLKYPGLNFEAKCLSANNNKIIKLVINRDVPTENDISLIFSITHSDYLETYLPEVIERIRVNNISDLIVIPHETISFRVGHHQIAINITPYVQADDLETAIKKSWNIEITDFLRAIKNRLTNAAMIGTTLFALADRFKIRAIDIKPGNFLMSPKVALISDLKSLELEGKLLDPTKTSPIYAPPELSPRVENLEAVQVYSYAVMLLQIVLGINAEQLFLLLHQCPSLVDNKIVSVLSTKDAILNEELLEEIRTQIQNRREWIKQNINDESKCAYELSFFDERLIDRVKLLALPEMTGITELICQGMQLNPEHRPSLLEMLKLIKVQIKILSLQINLKKPRRSLGSSDEDSIKFEIPLNFEDDMEIINFEINKPSVKPSLNLEEVPLRQGPLSYSRDDKRKKRYGIAASNSPAFKSQLNLSLSSITHNDESEGQLVVRHVSTPHLSKESQLSGTGSDSKRVTHVSTPRLSLESPQISNSLFNGKKPKYQPITYSSDSFSDLEFPDLVPLVTKNEGEAEGDIEMSDEGFTPLANPSSPRPINFWAPEHEPKTILPIKGRTITGENKNPRQNR